MTLLISTWRKFIYKKNMVISAKLARKQTCQIYLRHDKNMKCILVCEAQ